MPATLPAIRAERLLLLYTSYLFITAKLYSYRCCF